MYRKKALKYQNQIRNINEAEEWARCAQDPIYFICTYIYIQHPIRGKVRFNLYPFQIALINVWLLKKYTVCLKPRQMGISQLAAAFALWFAMFHPYKTILNVNLKFSVALGWLRRVKFMYENLPDFLKTPVVNGTGQYLGTADRLMFANGSDIFVQATTENAGRSDSLSLLIMDEVAFQRYAATTWAAAQPTLSTGGRSILFSSAYTVGNFFHQTYIDALASINSFFPVRLKWQMHPERSNAWYDEQKRALGAKRMAQEVDCNFLQAGYNVFDMAKIRAIEERLGELAAAEYDDQFRPSEGGGVKIYTEPRKDAMYYLGGDVASGRARDYSAFSVFDRYGVEHACYKGKLGLKPYAELMAKVGKRFNTAVLAPESNAIGEGVIAYLQEMSYPKIYHTVRATLRTDEFKKPESPIAGWLTTGKTRNEIITRLDDDLTTDNIEINNPYFVNEAKTFIYNDQNKPVAMGKGSGTNSGMFEDDDNLTGGVAYADDSILGLAIGNYVRSYPNKFKIALPVSGGR